jgi:hypothetical protein
VFRGFGGDDFVAAILKDMPGGAFGAMLAVMASSPIGPVW